MITISMNECDKLEAISMLFKLIKEDSCKKIIVFSELDQDRETNEIIENEQQHFQKKIDKIMLELGIPHRLIGYTFIRDSLEIMLSKSKTRYNLSKEVYPVVAVKNETGSHNVERNIRSAIEVTFLNGSPKIKEIFQCKNAYNMGHPTNSEFLCTIMEYIRRNE